jgi:hypothetical protein
MKKRTDTRVKDSDPCPKHPRGSHTWGECRSRQGNQNQSSNKPANRSMSKRDDDNKKPKPANSYHVAFAEEVESPSNKGTPPCFTIETLDQLDDHLSSFF